LDVLACSGKYQGNWTGGYQVSNSANLKDLRKMCVEDATPLSYIYTKYIKPKSLPSVKLGSERD
jgi:hypothetical protein